MISCRTVRKYLLLLQVLPYYIHIYTCIFIPAAVKNNVINIFLVESKFEIDRYTYRHIYRRMDWWIYGCIYMYECMYIERGGVKESG